LKARSPPVPRPPVFKGTNLGDITLGNSSLSGGQRYISAFGSDTNVELLLQSKGTGRVLLSSAGDITLNSNNVVRITASPTSNGGITVSSDGSTHNTIESSYSLGSFNIYAVGQGFAAAAGQDLNIRAGQAGSIGVQNAGNLNLSTNTPNGGGNEGAVNIQTRAEGLISFFAGTPVVRQAAATDLQSFYNRMVAYNLVPAATLSGGGGGGIIRSVNNISTNTTAGAAAAVDYVYICTSTFTLTLPTAVGNTNVYTIKNIGSGTITVNTTSSQTIDGGLTAVLSYQYLSIDVVSNGTNWVIV
jgi:hypothetical protein